MNRSLSFLRQLLYDLEREFGIPAALYRVTVGVTDVLTGVKSNTRTHISVPRMILLPTKYQDKGNYGTAMTVAIKNFSYGGLFQVGDRVCIINGMRLPRDYVIATNDYVVYQGKRFDIIDFTQLDYSSGWYLHLRQNQVEPPYATEYGLQNDRLYPTDSFMGVVL